MKSSIKAVFTALLLLGASLSYGQHKQMQLEKKKQHKQEYFEQLGSELELSEDQEIQLKAIFEERHEQMKAQRKANADLDRTDEEARKQAKMKQIEMRRQLNAEMDLRVAEVLNDEQMVRYKAMSKEKKLEMKERHLEQVMDEEHIHRRMKEGDLHQHEDGTEHSH